MNYLEVNKKYIIIGLVVAVVLMIVSSFISTNNTMIGLEENVSTAQSDVQIQEQRRYDLITKLVQVVEHAANYEQETQTKIAELRSNVNSGNVEQAGFVLRAIAEAYPELKANQNYVELMNELSVTENLIAEHRKTVNKFVKSYRFYSRSFPARLYLAIMGYDVQDFSYLEFSDNALPDNLFDE